MLPWPVAWSEVRPGVRLEALRTTMRKASPGVLTVLRLYGVRHLARSFNVGGWWKGLLASDSRRPDPRKDPEYQLAGWLWGPRAVEAIRSGTAGRTSEASANRASCDGVWYLGCWACRKWLYIYPAVSCVYCNLLWRSCKPWGIRGVGTQL